MPNENLNAPPAESLSDLPAENPEAEKWQQLTAMTIDRQVDTEKAAWSMAEQKLQEELAEGKGVGKFIRQVWKGNLFRGYYETKYRHEAQDLLENGEDENWQKMNQSVMERFMSSYDEAIHKNAGEEREFLEDNHKAVQEAKELISKFADGEFGNGEQGDKNFHEAMKRVAAENGLLNKDHATLDNYESMAKAIRGNLEHGASVEQMQAEFKWMRGEARGGVRTEAHLNAVEKIVDKYEHGRFSKFIPPEIIAGAATAALTATQAAASSAAKAITFGVGGVAVSGVAAGLKESTRTTKDRTRRAQEIASGLGSSEETSYDEKMNDTMYETFEASKLTQDLAEVLEHTSDNPMGAPARADLLIRALVDVESATDLSDTKGIDLISYSNPKEIDRERLALDEQRAEAKAALARLNPDYQEQLNNLIDQRKAEILEANTAKDEAFQKLKRNRAVKMGVKTAAITGVTMLATHQIAELFSQPETITTTETTPPQEIKLSTGEAASEYGTQVERIDWGTNGTSYSEGNELGIQMSADGDGVQTSMFGESTTWGGGSIDFEQAAAEGKIVGYVSLSEGTQATPIEVIGQLNANGQLEFIPEPGSPAAACFENGEFTGKFFEVAYDAGVSADGVQQIIPLATEVGPGLESGINVIIPGTEEIITEVVDNPTGFAVPLPFARRRELSRPDEKERSRR